jgi:hypothetical protein
MLTNICHLCAAIAWYQVHDMPCAGTIAGGVLGEDVDTENAIWIELGVLVEEPIIVGGIQGLRSCQVMLSAICEQVVEVPDEPGVEEESCVPSTTSAGVPVGIDGVGNSWQVHYVPDNVPITLHIKTETADQEVHVRGPRPKT